MSGFVDQKQMDRTPVTLITGFLGAGKSSLINRFIASFPERRFAVIVNEFGEVPLESQIIRSHKGEIYEFSNGCMCCVARNDLMRAVRRLAQREERFDHLVVEASGLSDPVPVVRSFLQQPGKYSVQTVVCVVDGVNFLHNRREFAVAETQVRFSDFVLISKSDSVTSQRISEVEREVARISPVPLIRLGPRTPLALYLDDVPQNSVGRRVTGLEQPRVAAHGTLSHCTLSSTEPIDPAAFRRFIDNLPEGVIRGKGVVYFSGKDGMRYKAILQVVGARRELDAVRWKRTEARRSDLLIIGRGIDPQALTRQFVQCCSSTVLSHE